MRKRQITVSVVVLLVAILGLGYVLATIPRISFTRSGCMRTEFDREAILSARWVGSHIHLQLGLIDNCCLDDLAVDWTKSGLAIRIVIKSIVATPCRCMCSFDVAVDLGPLPISDYQIQVFHGENIVGHVSLGAGGVCVAPVVRALEFELSLETLTL
jgi:hypothetical protein